jgi:chemotaxis protein methyltransferase CheR
MADHALPEIGRAVRLPLGEYRAEHVAERIRRAIAREGATDGRELARLLAVDPAARSRFRRSVAVSVSGLFRDPAQFDLLERQVLPGLLERGRRISVWSAGCADGSELYSVALLLQRLEALDGALLLGSDLLDENLAVAHEGACHGVAFRPDLRQRLRWERRDLLSDGAPPGKWRLVLCRNLAIYLAPEAKRRLHRTLAAALAHDGVLMLGRSERIADPKELALARVAPHVYRRLP